MPLRPADGLRGTRERIVTLLRRSALTANEIASALGLTHNAVRVHLAELRAVGVVRQGGLRRSASRPAAIYELVPRADAVFSRMHVPFVAHLLRLLSERMSRTEMEDLMRAVGDRLAAEWPVPQGDLGKRVETASGLLQDLGALTDIEARDGGYVIRGAGCLLAEAVHARPEVCHAMEGLLTSLLRTPVHECCQRGEHPRCCFEIGADGPPRRTPRVMHRT